MSSLPSAQPFQADATSNGNQATSTPPEDKPSMPSQVAQPLENGAVADRPTEVPPPTSRLQQSVPVQDLNTSSTIMAAVEQPDTTDAGSKVLELESAPTEPPSAAVDNGNKQPVTSTVTTNEKAAASTSTDTSASVDSSDDDATRVMAKPLPATSTLGEMLANEMRAAGTNEQSNNKPVALEVDRGLAQGTSGKATVPSQESAPASAESLQAVNREAARQSDGHILPLQGPAALSAAVATSVDDKGPGQQLGSSSTSAQEPAAATSAAAAPSAAASAPATSSAFAAAAAATSAAATSSASAKRAISAVDDTSSLQERPTKRAAIPESKKAAPPEAMDVSPSKAATPSSSSSSSSSPEPTAPSADNYTSRQDADSTTPSNAAAETVQAAPPPPTAAVANVTPPTWQDGDVPKCDPEFASLVNLDPIPEVKPLPGLSPRDVAELELALQIGDKWNHSHEDNTWREDWSGNLGLIDKELVMNKDQLAQNPSTKLITVPFCDWATKNAKSENDFRPIRLLFSYVYHMQGTPPMAQKLLAYSINRPANSVQQRRQYILEAVQRISYDPIVLNQDLWTTEKAATPEGASGGAYLIGRRVIWRRYEAIVIAFVHDEGLGDLWKAMWLEDLDTFDLEADELQQAMQKWEKKQALKERKALGGAKVAKKPSSSQRFAASTNFTVDGIEHGIVLAASYHKNARRGILWPARIMHVSEVKALGPSALSRRSSSKNGIHAVFLAPYWNGAQASSRRTAQGTVDTGDVNADNPFCTGPLFELEVVEISAETIKKYPCDDADIDSLNIDKLRASFRFLGLPKAAFARFLDSHRIAMSLKAYAQREIVKSSSTSADADLARTLSSLTETHSLTVKTPLFPQAVLGLPFEYALSNLPHPTEQSMIGADGEEATEPVMKLHLMLKAMEPPLCWGSSTDNANGSSAGGKSGSMAPTTPVSSNGPLMITSPNAQFTPMPNLNNGQGEGGSSSSTDTAWALNNFTSDYLLRVIGDGQSQSAPLFLLGMQLSGLLGRLRIEAGSLSTESSLSRRKDKLRLCLSKCLMVKGHGEDLITDAELPKDISAKTIMTEWRKTCERIYKRASIKFSTEGFGDGVTSVITDSRCNAHITASGSFERAVRLPAAIRGAKKAGAGSNKNFPLVYTVEDHYLDVAEKKILPKAHKRSYLKRLKNKISALPAEAKGVPLTDDSDGEGGEDTMGSRGSFTAAVVGVAAALKGVDMIVGGQCVNVFCAIRPPGHHAGRELRPMKAISNGFCLLNAAASAALYATAPKSEGGLGLKRVCIIDFDVHHGNGSQDILCSTQDSRFLYVSLHAGGPHINGYEDPGESDDGLYRHSLGTSKNEGIFPGRCGDTSPHEGVLNIPLGQKVTAAAMGQALVSQVAPAVDKFSPELIILSAGFDAHQHDPLGMGGLTAEDFGSVTEVACQMAFKSCSGRVLSVLEGGYGVPCCVPQKMNLFLPEGVPPLPPPKLLDLGDDLPAGMEDEIPDGLRQKLERCHLEGFMDAVQQHVVSLSKLSSRSPKQQTTSSKKQQAAGVKV